MDKFLLFSFLGMLIVVHHGVAGNVGIDDIGMLEELDQICWEMEEENEMESSPISSWTSDRGSKVLVNVDSFGAVGDGVSDDTQAFQKAWDIACSTPGSVFLVPQGRTYLVNATRFQGPCSDRLVIQIDGTIRAPAEPKDWDPKFPRTWLEFYQLNGVLFQGGGVIDGSGSKWWASSCKKNKSNPCRGAPTALTIDSSSAVQIKGLTIQNSQQMHFVISRSDSIRVLGVLISAPGDSPNTDGIHISASTDVSLQDCKIGTGDDCISIVNASTGIKMKRIYCGPGHGISIGSLGKDNSTGIVSKVVVDTAFLQETTNGLRIKTWQTSAVNISQIVYRNIRGTTKSAKAMKFACSDTVPCRNIVLSNINLEKKDGTVETYCNSAEGFGYGVVQPSADCLSSRDKEYVFINQQEDVQVAETSRSSSEDHDIVHTEL
ncbi:hypothetical protein CIPAW_05G185600 [Carya illinoinensis]|uniref:Polygalacturonase n=1 Tax=Carya illinoinensis TaxID=32201 RepID=A0A8T1QLU8_CARIL|nr:hypothetical protein CIPAW_05G185600 [Carya illinoinensis]